MEVGGQGRELKVERVVQLIASHAEHAQHPLVSPEQVFVAFQMFQGRGNEC
jgi:hypothetical protein